MAKTKIIQPHEINQHPEVSLPSGARDLCKHPPFVYLRAVRYVGSTGKPYWKSLWLCLCKCGNYIIADAGSLKNGNTTSCSCRRYEQMEK